jgi:hypothetical protein
MVDSHGNKVAVLPDDRGQIAAVTETRSVSALYLASV